MTRTRWVGLALGVGIFLSVFGVAVAVTVFQVSREIPSTLAVRSTVVLSGDNLGLWHDEDKTRPVTSLEFRSFQLQPPLDNLSNTSNRVYSNIFIENRSDITLTVVAPCGDVESPPGTVIGQIGADLVDVVTGEYLLSACTAENTVAPGGLLSAGVFIDMEPGLAEGEYSFTTVFGAIGTDEVAIPPPAGMVSWWPGDGHPFDIMDGNHGTLTGDATYTGGKVGQAFSFDGSGDFVVVPDDPSLNITGDVTVDLWARRTVFGGSEDAIMVAKGAGPFGTSDQPVAYALLFGTGDELLAGFQVADGTAYAVLGPVVSDSAFHHYAYVRSGDTHKLFMDGVDVTVVTFILFTDGTFVFTGDGSFFGSPSDTSELPLTIGALLNDQIPSGFNLHFGGLVDEVEVFNRALTDAEVRAIYEAGSAGKVKPPAPTAAPGGMVSWWSADGHSLDIMGSNHGTLTGDATYTGGMVEQAFAFDGSGDFVVVPDDPSLNITGDVTVDLWARRTDFGRFQVMVSKGSLFPGTADKAVAYALKFGGNNRLASYIERATGSNNSVEGPVVTDSNLHHYAYVRSGTTQKLFMDGVMVATNNFGTIIGDTSGVELVIGSTRHPQDVTGFRHHFGGIIDEVEVFDLALSDAEIRAIYEAGSAGKVKPSLNIRAYIDGRSQLILQGNTVHWHHIDFVAPGRWGADEPTYLNGLGWHPIWPDVPNPENGGCGCDSSSY